jgi:hypothetical protein
MGIQDDPRFKGGAWVFCGNPTGPFTLSVCATRMSECDQNGTGRVHAFPGWLNKKQYGRGDSSVKVKPVAIEIEACVFAPRTKAKWEVPDAV